MKLYSPEERERRLKIIQDLVKTESWKIIKESIEFWCYSKLNEIPELYASGKKMEAEDLARQIWAVKRVFSEPQIIIQETSAWLKKLEWLKKIAPKKETSV